MFMFGGWDYESVLAMVDDLVYARRYGGFHELLTNYTVKELMEIFTVIQNKERAKDLKDAASQSNEGISVPTEDLSPEMLKFLMDT